MSTNKIAIDINADVTSRLKFNPEAINNMFCVGKLESIELTDSEVDADSKWEYKGLTIPRLAFHFVNHKTIADEPDRYFTYAELPVARIKTDGTPSEEDAYNKMLVELWRRLKHIHDAYKTAKAPNYRPITAIPEFTSDPASSPEVRLAEIKELFTIFFNSFKGVGEEKPMWLDASGQSIPMTMKLIATPASNGKGSFLTFPRFVGEGFIQPYAIKNGKIDTTLRFKGAETSIITAGGSMPEASQNLPAGFENADPSVQAALLGK